MSDINHSKTPNLSIGTLDGRSGVSAAFLTVDSTASFNCAGIAAFTGAESHSGAITQSGMFASTSTTTIGSSVALGTAGSRFSGIVRSTVSVLCVGTAHDSTTTSAALSGITVGDPILNIEKASIWSGAYYDLGVEASCVSWGAVQFVTRNSSATAFNTAAMNFTITWMDLA